MVRLVSWCPFGRGGVADRPVVHAESRWRLELTSYVGRRTSPALLTHYAASAVVRSVGVIDIRLHGCDRDISVDHFHSCANLTPSTMMSG